MFTTVSPSSRTPYPACNQHSVTLVTRTKRHIAEGFLEAARWFPHSLCTLSLFPGESPHLLPGPFRGKPTALSQNMRTKELVKEDLVHRDEESFLNITFFFFLNTKSLCPSYWFSCQSLSYPETGAGALPSCQGSAVTEGSRGSWGTSPSCCIHYNPPQEVLSVDESDETDNRVRVRVRVIILFSALFCI